MTNKSAFVVLAAMSCFAWSPAVSKAEGDSMISIVPEMKARKAIFDWSKDRCSDQKIIPDAPLRAYRRADGQITAIAAHYLNWSMKGQSFDTLKTNCNVTFGPNDTESDQHAWIEATYTHDGQEVTALLSRELSTNSRPVNCKPAQGKSCWVGDIVAAQSNDMGERFSIGAPVVTLGNIMPAGSRTRFGAFTTSNIARGSDGYYMIVFVEAQGEIRGNCLLRSDNPLDPTKWRGWNGKDFALDPRKSNDLRRCTPLKNLDQPIRSISWLPSSNRWIAVFSGREKSVDRESSNSGFFFSESRDLKDWSKQRLIVKAATSPRQMGWDSYWSYPVIIDPLSKSRNFDTIDHENSLLIFTEHHLHNNAGSYDRDVVSIPVKITLGN